MKILQIINSHALKDGGAQRLALEMHRDYQARGHDSHLLSLMRSPTEETNTYSLGLGSPYAGSVLARLCRFLKQSRWKDVDLIHVHLFPAQFWVAIAAKWLKLTVPLITTEHNTFNRRRSSAIGRLCDGWTLSAYQRIVCISAATCEALAKWQPQVNQKLIVIPNGIDLQRINGAYDQKTKRETPLVISVGRISEQKNYETAIHAVELLREREFEYWIVGQDESGGRVQQLAENLGFADKIRFLGYQADVPKLLHQAQIYLLTSKWEGFGLAVAEAMASGLPVICSDVPGVREVVGFNQNHQNNQNNDGNAEQVGFLVDPHSPPAIAGCLAELLDNPNFRDRLGAAAKHRAQQFDIKLTIEGYLNLYEQTLTAPI